MQAERPSARRRRIRFAFIGAAYLLQMLAQVLHLPTPVMFATSAVVLILLIVEFNHD